MSIRLKLALVISGAVLAATLAASGAFLSLQAASLRRAQEEKVSLWKANAANIASESMLADDPLMLIDYLQGLTRGQREIARVRFDTGSGWEDAGRAAPGAPRAMRIETLRVEPPPGSKRRGVAIELW
ncbi:MAG: hypothetical protein PHF00_09910, partial [Elusimicrobia bacterium]|nr:hypothetical protein [Elusimicrobiota bacterium]